jgi:hypothetical protein
MKKFFLAVASIAVTSSPAFAGENYVDGFVKHWRNTFTSQSSIVMLALGVGAVGVFIITRAKWKK